MERIGGLCLNLGTVALILTLGGGPTASGEVLEFQSGERVELPAAIGVDSVVLRSPDGTYTFPPGAFRSIRPSRLPEEEWEDRWRAVRGQGSRERFEAAWWALLHGLTPQAVALFRSIQADDPAHQPTARIVAVLDRLEASCCDPDLNALRRPLKGRFEVVRGPHVLLFHQHPAAEAAERVEVLERVLLSYYIFLTAQGFDLQVLDRRMASAWFARREDYLDFLKAEQAEAFLTTRGYYHPTRDLVICSDSRGGEVPQGTADSDRVISERSRLLRDLKRRSLNLGIAAHEMVHQLIRHSGFAPRHEDFPIWLHEGFATQFEVIRAGRWAGISRPHPYRLPDWRALRERPRLVPLLRDSGFGHGYQRDAYAQAWSLVAYLWRTHPNQFRAVIDLLRNPDPDQTPAADRTLSAFRSVFGDDLSRLEAAWIRSTASLRTSLETARDHSPHFWSAGWATGGSAVGGLVASEESRSKPRGAVPALTSSRRWRYLP